MKTEYLIYSDESYMKGKYYSNFYGGALINYKNLQIINNILETRKLELGLGAEIKWSKMSHQYLNKYIEIINCFFDLIRNQKIKIRIRFRQNAYVPKNLSYDQLNHSYQLLYYQFIKHAFGLDYCNPEPADHQIYLKLYFDQLPDTKIKNKEFKRHIYYLNNFLSYNNIHINQEDIVKIDSHKHVILQCMDIILGAINFKLNEMDKQKLPNSNRRGKTTIAKEKLYKVILSNIRTIYPNFNIGISTSDRNDPYNRWKDPYRHWNFKPKEHHFDENLTKKIKKNRNSTIPT